MAWRSEWVSDEVDRLWPEGVPQIRNEHGSANVTGYAQDEADNLIYLGMDGRKRLLDSIRATIQARQRRKLFQQGRPVYPLPTHYSQTWQHLPDYGAYHATAIADPALSGKWQSGEEIVYLLVFEGELLDGSTPENQAIRLLSLRLSEALPIPIKHRWAKALWEAGVKKDLIGELEFSGDCLAGFGVNVSETGWPAIISGLVKEGKVETVVFRKVAHFRMIFEVRHLTSKYFINSILLQFLQRFLLAYRLSPSYHF